MKASNHGRSRIGGHKSAERFFLFILIARGLFGQFPPFSYFLRFFFQINQSTGDQLKITLIFDTSRTWWCHKWKHFPRYWPFVRGIHRSPVNSPHKGQWRAALMFSSICAWLPFDYGCESVITTHCFMGCNYRGIHNTIYQWISPHPEEMRRSMVRDSEVKWWGYSDRNCIRNKR